MPSRFVSSVVIMVFKDKICRLHGKLFGLTDNQVAVAMYAYLGMFKIFVIVFSIVPYVTLVLMR